MDVRVVKDKIKEEFLDVRALKEETKRFPPLVIVICNDDVHIYFQALASGR